jgi:hypothetical protein
MIYDKRKAGVSYGSIANELNARKIQTAQGGKQWYASTVSSVYAAICREIDATKN